MIKKIDEEKIHLTNLALIYYKILDSEDASRQSRTIETESSVRESTATNNGSLQLTEEHAAKEFTIKVGPTSHQLQENYYYYNYYKTTRNLNVLWHFYI